MFFCSLLTGSRGLPHKGPSVVRDHRLTPVWQPIASFLVLAFANPQNNFPDIRWQKGEPGGWALDKAAPILFQSAAADTEDARLSSP